ncbi:MAG: carboxypeptidase-like regulatory domain-containing protein [Planctomycetes bacterium]|nr:carboxypeptidase-like regulatory domain-containing protein [Planctomycetota bacterium]MCH9727023.1 carboxypeptidase-like regulatory domain-containing protein [Planctomycetota bacterium]MCH9776151.1 carboxypeptidase-like regulatory domain-containing protein [Planctomycetota bacterium]MCH9791035.1 carboxypeptidase-like regulatory domain-containing protein [Planctomycetota bacterium]
MKFSKLFVFALLFVAPLMFSVGCGGSGASDQPDLGTVSGVVKMDGQPLANVTVSFSPAQGRPSNGKTDTEGNYNLGYIGDTKGAVIGAHTVSISTPQEAPTPPGTTYKDPIPAKYNVKTTLKEEVKAGDNTINFDLVPK